VNFFQPVMKLVTKARHGAKVHKVYDAARTPYQRLLEASALMGAKRQELAATYHDLNPITLLKQINKNLERLWNLAKRTAYQQRKVNTYKALITCFMTQHEIKRKGSINAPLFLCNILTECLTIINN